jgi:flagellar hook-associated protein 2
MAVPLFNIGGLASGLDTNSIVSQLMQLERIPLTQVQSRRATYQTKNDAWNQISTKLSDFRTKMRAIDDDSDWKSFAKATSSNTDAVGVSVSGSPSETNVSFTVQRLATSHQMVTDSALTSPSDLVGTGTFEFTLNGTTHSVTTDGSTTVADLAAKINQLDAGISANVITVDTGAVELLFSADSSGDDGVFTTNTDLTALGAVNVAQQGYDSQIVVGSGPGAITIERPTNTITDFISGIAIDLKQTTSSPVSVAASKDNDAIVSKVRDMVTSMNSALSFIESKTKTATEGGTSAGPLAADSTARGLKLSLRSAMSGAVAGLSGSYTTASSVGISLNRDGSISFDETKLRSALESDYEGVKALFARTTSSTDSRVTVSRAANSDVDGSHTVQITQAATKASVTGSLYDPPLVDASFDITTGSKTATVVVAAGADIDTAINAINAALVDAGIQTIVAVSESGNIIMSATRHGSSESFTVGANDFGLAGTFTGQDVAGTIDGAPATGSGRSLSGVGDLDGLILSITASDAQVASAGGTLDLGSVTVQSGLASNFTELLDGILDTGGTIDRATDRWDAQMKLADERIDQLQQRLTDREAALRRQYTSLETTMARLQSVASQLSSGLSSLSSLG